MLIEPIYSEFLLSSGVTTDTRTIKGNALYFALKGEHFDGNDFVEEALAKGCRAAVSDRPGLNAAGNVFLVDNTLHALQQLASFHRRKWGGQVLAITGSNGKTTTKELLHAVLSQQYRVLATEGNLNNHIGVPLTLLKLKNEELAIIEMGANHKGEIAALCEIAGPDTGIITNIGKAHLEGFGGLEGVRKGKGELYDYLAAHGGTAIADLSDPVLASMAGERKLKVFSYGMGGGFDVNGHLDAHDDQIEGSFDTGGDSSPLRSGLFGAYNFRNMLAAAAAGIFMKVPHRAITEAVERYVPQNNRSQTVRGKTNTLILDAYNANPTSMRNALAEFEQRNHPGKIAILGDMFELGADEQKEHRALLEQLVNSNIKTVLLVGERFGTFAEDPVFPFHFFNTLEDCIAYLRKHPPENALIMLKGSRKNALENATKLLLDC
jgi:UDP-N-acetylmuramoyl-tripeptide--D-alanyl-D-alanine ligase